MSLTNLLQLNRKSKKLTLMNLVDITGLSYGKVYRIFNGKIEKPSPNNLKRLAKALQLDYSYLFEKAGYLPNGTDSQNHSHYLLPILSWDFCHLAFPFKEPLGPGLSDEHYLYHKPLKDGFILNVDNKHALIPLFTPKDQLICDPNTAPSHNDTVLYINIKTKQFNYGIFKSHHKKSYIMSLHQNNWEDINIDTMIQSPIVARIIGHEKS